MRIRWPAFAIAGLTVCACALWFGFGQSPEPSFTGEPFNASTWKSDVGTHGPSSSARSRQTSDVLTRVLKKGMTKEAVRTRLGKPDNEFAGNPWSEYLVSKWPAPATTLTYATGLTEDPAEDVSPWQAFIVIGFDRDGKLIWSDDGVG